MTEIGVIFLPQFAPETLVAYARGAEAAGLDELWLWEDCFTQGGLTTAAAALAVTDRIRLATGVLPMPLRNVALTAMEVSVLARLHPGRLLLGVGHGVQSWMGQAGARVASPLTLMREYVPALRALLAGEEVTASGRYVNLDRVRLDWPPADPLPLWAAGEGPKTLALTGELADGTVLTGGTTPALAERALGIAAAGRAAAGRPGAQQSVVFVMTVFTETPDAAPAARARLERQWDDWGLTGEMRGGAAGTPAEVAEQLHAWQAAGVERIALQPMPDADRAAFLRAAGEVAALLR